MLLLELSHTSHSQAATGIQNVCRQLYSRLERQRKVEALVHDPFLRDWRLASDKEKEMLRPDFGRSAGAKKKDSWAASEKLRGTLQRWKSQVPPLPADTRAVLFPEFILHRSIDALPRLQDRLPVKRLAIFHDAIALKLPEYSAAKTVARHPYYLSALRRFDAIAAVSEAARDELLDFWRWCGPGPMPPVEAIPLGVAVPSKGAASAESAIPRALCVGTLEGRKNQLSVLRAAELLWAEGLQFELELVGMAHRETGHEVMALLKELQAKGRALHWLGPVDASRLEERYRACSFTVYCSLLEGFGLPVLESVAYGKPCLCTKRGGLAEASRGGGCLTIEDVTPDAIAQGLRRMIAEPGLREHLAGEARARTFRTWDDYGADINAWVDSVLTR